MTEINQCHDEWCEEKKGKELDDFGQIVVILMT
ncbi:hypothetical protein cce_3188 [Crocosphaera subtropica ATCC 51142]|uniref:Uncharacterized protein n=1 Tax=Crocosphaera subtropica (strain ATCC 51142 / BH68) TaxID=43989 RepID=B1WXJ5_CROS5|nr:hypothetical protein cce_3188 [Crocosphaera subtropica ATCC 51142]